MTTSLYWCRRLGDPSQNPVPTDCPCGACEPYDPRIHGADVSRREHRAALVRVVVAVHWGEMVCLCLSPNPSPSASRFIQGFIKAEENLRELFASLPAAVDVVDEMLGGAR